MIEKTEIERAKAANPLADEFLKRGIKLKRRGKQYFCICPTPNHQDTEESCSVDPHKQLWHCFGCNEGGDIYRLIILLDGVDFREAHRRLGGEAEISNNGNSGPTQQSAQVTVEQLQWLARYVEDCRRLMLETPKAQDYAHSRGISKEAIIAFKLCYSDGKTLKKLSPTGRAALTQLGVITESGRELLAGCVIFPLIDAQTNQAVSLYGRHIESKQHLYLPGKRRGVCNPTGARATDTVILAESVIDALALRSIGIRNIIPIYGINGLTQEIIDHLRECRIKEAILIMDSDEAGRQAAPQHGAKLAAHNISARIVELPAKDPSEFISQGGTVEQLRAIIAAKQPIKSTDNFEAISQDSEQSKLDSKADGTQVYAIEGRQYLIRGLIPDGLDRMKVNVRLQAGSAFHLDTFDLYQDNARRKFAEKAAQATGITQQQIELELKQMIDPLDVLRLALRGNGQNGEQRDAAMTADEKAQAMARLLDPGLIESIKSDFEKCGFIGDRDTALLAVLASISRKLPKPLSVLVIARSGAGKSALQDVVCDFVPKEDLVRVTRLTGQSLFYKDPYSLQFKQLAIAEEQGALEALYSLRTLVSDQWLSIAATRTDPRTGKLHTEHYEIYGPVSVIVTTTSPHSFDEETRSRFLQMTADESREQTEAILAMQRRARTPAGVAEKAAAATVKRLAQNMQRLLRPLAVINPYVEELTYPTERLLTRREQEKFLTLIDVIALLHQYQRETVTPAGSEIGCVKVEWADIELATALARKIMWRSFDEMSPPVRGMWEAVKALYQQRAAAGQPLEEAALSRREIRGATGWTDWQVRVYCEQLVELEYLALISQGNGKPALYKLVLPMDAAKPSLQGLADIEQLKERLKKKG